MSESFGTRREREVRELAATLGVADFVFAAPQVSKGTGIREPSGDGLLIVGGRGAVLQVKARAPTVASNDSSERALRWVKKNAYKARSQGVGAKRELRRRQMAGTPLEVLPVRAQGLPTDEQRKYVLQVQVDPTTWPTIVIVDHLLALNVDLGFSGDTIWITVEDWRELHRRLRSTGALLDYVSRCLAACLHVPLGCEVDRYSALREADVDAAIGRGTTPLLPDVSDFDVLGVELFHEVVDRVWPDDGPLPWQTPDQYRKIVEFLDCVPPVVQGQVGQWFLRKRKELAEGAHVASGAIRLNHRDRLVFACTDFHRWSDEDWRAEFTLLTGLRHIQALDTGAAEDTVTLGVGVLVGSPFSHTGVAHTFVLLDGRAGALDIPPDLRRSFEHRYGIHEHRSGAFRPSPTVGRNDPCPCMSGRKYKKCCGSPGRGA